jgi:hypothetical protein
MPGQKDNRALAFTNANQDSDSTQRKKTPTKEEHNPARDKILLNHRRNYDPARDVFWTAMSHVENTCYQFPDAACGVSIPAISAHELLRCCVQDGGPRLENIHRSATRHRPLSRARNLSHVGTGGYIQGNPLSCANVVRWLGN